METHLILTEYGLVFQQVDGTLTLLDPATGEVILRGTDHPEELTDLRYVNGTLVGRNYNTLRSYNPETLTPQWQKPYDDAEIQANDDFLILSTAEELLRIDEQTGNVIWKISAQPLNQFHLKGDTVIALSGLTIPYYLFDENADSHDFESTRSLRLINANNGETIWNEAFIENSDNMQMEASDEIIKLSSIWDEFTMAETTQTIRSYRWTGELLDVATTVCQGGCSDSLWYPSLEFERIDGKVSYRIRDSHSPITTNLDLTSGTLTSRFWYSDNDYTKLATLLEYDDNWENSWKSIIPYMTWWGSIRAVLQEGDRLFIGTNLGQVECLDMKTGRSIWKYTFPVHHPPKFTVKSSLENFYNRYTKSKATGGSISVPPDLVLTDSTVHELIIYKSNYDLNRTYDPAPLQPYKDYNKALSMAWLGVIVPLLMVFGFLVINKWKNPEPWVASLFGTLCLLISVRAFFSYCLVSGAIFAGFCINMSFISAYIGWIIRSQFRMRRIGACLIMLLLPVALICSGYFVWNVDLHYYEYGWSNF